MDKNKPVTKRGKGIRLNAYLILEDGTIYKGKSFGAAKDVAGEVIFSTGMVGYQEILTMPALCGKLVCMTYPLQGNYGVNDEDGEADIAFAGAMIAREVCDVPSNFRMTGNLNDYMIENGIPGISGIDTRALTRKLRTEGSMKAKLVVGECPDIDKVSAELKEMSEVSTLSQIGERGEKTISADGEKKFTVALLDLGVKKSLLKALASFGCEVQVYPASTSAEKMLTAKPDGIVLAGGAENPFLNAEIIEEIKKLALAKLPIFGVGAGHLALAATQGLNLYKMLHGHHGDNLPALDLKSGRTYITSQCHGYAVAEENLTEAGAELSFRSLNDQSVEGLSYANLPAVTVQFDPDTCMDASGTGFVFERFISLMEGGKA